MGAKSELTFTVPTSDADVICKALIDDGKKGVAFESFSRLKAFVGIMREKAKDSKRKETRLAHEKKIADKKESLQTSFEKASTIVADATEKIKEMETATVPLPNKTKAMKSKEMNPLADETAATVEAAKAVVAAARKMIQDLGENVDQELKSF